MADGGLTGVNLIPSSMTLIMKHQNQLIKNRRLKTRNRYGLSLLEVILSIAILGTSMAVISQFFYLGYRAADRARRQFDATLICDSVMAELAGGVIEAQSTSGIEVPNVPDWQYSVDVVNSDITGLLLATVSVRQRNQDNIEMSLVRLLPDPDYLPEEDQ
jgi:type II secretory pathway pseudopilin PulG